MRLTWLDRDKTSLRIDVDDSYSRVISPSNPDWYEFCDCDDIFEFQEELALEVEHEAVRQKRRKAFAEAADPLFFKWQAGEATEEQWLAKRSEIKVRYPYPDTEN